MHLSMKTLASKSGRLATHVAPSSFTLLTLSVLVQSYRIDTNLGQDLDLDLIMLGRPLLPLKRLRR